MSIGASMSIFGLAVIILGAAILGFLIGSASSVDEDIDTDVKTYIPVNEREQEEINKPSVQEIEIVLKVLYFGASQKEKEVLKYLMLKEGIDFD